MIRDFHDYADGATIDTDICVIGSGAAGLTLAREFLHSALRVTLIEGGGVGHEEQSQELYQADIVGLPHLGVHEGRMRRFGGTTTAWGGQILRFYQEDFQPRPWVPNSGWPISYDDLSPFYSRAEAMLGVGGPPYSGERWPWLGAARPPFSQDIFTYRFSQSASLQRRNLAAFLRRELRASRNVDVLLHANAVEIGTNAQASHVDQVSIRSHQGRRGKVYARWVIMCGGGIETPRLLLASRQVAPQGVGNDADMVGRCFQDHISLRAGRFVPKDRTQVQHYFDPYFRRGVMYTCKMGTTATAQQEHGILNAMGHVKFEIPEDSGLQQLRLLMKAFQARTSDRTAYPTPGSLAHSGGEFARLAYGRAVLRRRLSLGRGDIVLLVDTEQAPNRESRVRLSSTADALGMPRAAVDWRVGALDIKTLHTFASLFKQDWERMGLGALELDDVSEAEGGWQNNMKDTYHHIGTTRMSRRPQAGVVNEDCRVHSIDNLFIGSSAVFPTSSSSNPTLTIMALCIRIADHLKATARLPSPAA